MKKVKEVRTPSLAASAGVKGPTLGVECWRPRPGDGSAGRTSGRRRRPGRGDFSLCAGTGHRPWFSLGFADLEEDTYGKEADNADVMHVLGLYGFSKSGLSVKPVLVNEVGGLRDRVLAAFVGSETPRGATDLEMVIDKRLATPVASATRPEDDGGLHTLWVEFDEHRSHHKNWSTG